ncbi:MULTISPECIES: MarR family winged helix-turn-helix transcriptional regulator [Actinomycetes]|uniref:HTH marR-type domain-containing protein n=2 Tax=Actinomycetes TaxID=1760 RepID=A0ABP6LLZ4_9MICC
MDAVAGEDAQEPQDAAPPARDLTGTSPKAKAWRTFLETSAIVSKTMEKGLHAATGLRLSDYNLLLVLAEAEGNQLRMGELAERMIFSPSRLSYQAKSLQTRGLITRCADPSDRRGMKAQLTDEGRRVFRDASQVHARHIRQIFHETLDNDEALALQRTCMKLLQTAQDTELA